MRTYTFPRVFPHAEIHTIRCKSSYGFYTLPLAFPHAAIHYFRCISTSLKIHLFWHNSTCGVSPILVYFRFSGIHYFLRDSACGYTLVIVYFRLLKIHFFVRNSTCGNTLVKVYFRLLEIHFFVRNSTCGNTLVKVYFRLLEIHFFVRCKSSYGFYTLPLAFPHAAIHYFRCISTSLKIHLFWRNSTCGVSPILVYFRFSGNSLFLAWFRMRIYTSHSVFPPVGNSLFRA